jgi:hypothetical protein
MSLKQYISKNNEVTDCHPSPLKLIVVIKILPLPILCNYRSTLVNPQSA